jgi:hypothetical protein
MVVLRHVNFNVVKYYFKYKTFNMATVRTNYFCINYRPTVLSRLPHCCVRLFNKRQEDDYSLLLCGAFYSGSFGRKPLLCHLNRSQSWKQKFLQRCWQIARLHWVTFQRTVIFIEDIAKMPNLSHVKKLNTLHLYTPVGAFCCSLVFLLFCVRPQCNVCEDWFQYLQYSWHVDLRKCWIGPQHRPIVRDVLCQPLYMARAIITSRVSSTALRKQYLQHKTLLSTPIFIIWLPYHKSQLFKRLKCGLVVRVPGYRSRGPSSIPGATRFSE